MPFRVENKYKRGPYHRSIRKFWHKSYEAMWDRNPPPEDDCGIAEYWKSLSDRRRPKHIFGFNSLESLTKWFTPKQLKDLKKHGYYIYEVPAKTIVLGSKQVVFIRDTKKRRRLVK